MVIKIVCLVLYYLVHWPNEDCVSVVTEKQMVLEEKRCAVGDECTVKNGKELWCGIVAGIGKQLRLIFCCGKRLK